MISKTWRDRLIYSVMSLFLGWHTIAIMFTPVPENNVIVKSFRNLFQPYLSLTGIDTNWDFFSPVGPGWEFRYVIKDSDRNDHTFTPITEVNWFTPNHRWDEKIFGEIIREPGIYGDYFAKFFCRKHAALRPLAITLFLIQEEAFSPQDHLLGMHRTKDPEYFSVVTLKYADCPKDRLSEETNRARSPRRGKRPLQPHHNLAPI